MIRPPADAERLAERYGTPLYVFDGAAAARAAEAFRAAWRPDDTIAYSVKCNPLVGLVARLARTGIGMEVASGFEYRTARRAGVPGERIVFNGPLKRPDELRRALREGATVILDGVEQIRAAAREARHAAPGARIGLRLTQPELARGDRFGIAPRMAPAAARHLARAGLAVTGLHVHLGAYRLGPLGPSGPPIHSVTVTYPVPLERFEGAARQLCETADAIGGVEWLDLGGGWPAADDVGPYREAVERALGPDRPPLILEPGRALVRDAGWLLVRVIARRGRTAAVVDAGVTQVPCVLWKRSPVRPAVPRIGEVRPTDLFGPLCLQHDAIAREVHLPPLREGDLVWIGQTGAYAVSQASPFIHPRASAVMIEDGRATMLRHPETDEEALAPQAEPLLVGAPFRVAGT